MSYNYRVYTKPTKIAPWKDTGIIESNREVADKVWADIIKNLSYHSFRLFPITYGVAIERAITMDICSTRKA